MIENNRLHKVILDHSLILFIKDNCVLFRIYRSVAQLALLWCWDEEIGVMTWTAGCFSSPWARGWRGCRGWVSMLPCTCACACSPTSSSSWSSSWVSAGATPLRPRRPGGVLRAPLTVCSQCLFLEGVNDLGAGLFVVGFSGIDVNLRYNAMPRLLRWRKVLSFTSNLRGLSRQSMLGSAIMTVLCSWVKVSTW